MSFMLDTGAAVTLLWEECWKEGKDSEKKLKTWQGPRLVGANGTPIPVLGRTNVEVTLGGETFMQNVAIVKSLAAEGILGMDFLKESKCTIDVGNGLLHIATRGATLLLHSPRKPEQQGKIRVRMKQSVRIPARCEMEVAAVAQKPLESGVWLLEGVKTKNSPAMVARTVTSPETNEVVVRLLNPGEEAATVHEGSVIAEIEALEETMIAAAETDPDDPPSRANDVSAEKQLLLWMLTEGAASQLSADERDRFYHLLLEFADIFTEGDGDLGRTDKLEHTINTGDNPPVRQAVRRLPPHRREEVHKLLNAMRQKQVIQPSKSPWASPIVLVRKKDGTTRFCIDYRKLNSVTRKDAYPLPRIDDTLTTLAGSKWFSTLDLVSGYWQVEVAEEDREKTAFCTTEGLYEFRVMPFGLCNAPATFQRLMDLMLTGLQWTSCLVYLDDVIILGRSFEDHILNIEAVFRRIREAGLKLKPQKCAFLKEQVCYLSHIVSREGVATDPAKIEKVKTWPAPSSPREVQRFLGFANYYRKFIRGFAGVAKPLHRLTEQNAAFRWTEECQQAFDDLRHKLTTAPILAYPDFSKPFILDTDASNTGIGAVLSQLDEQGDEQAVAYGSRMLSKAERQYCVTRKELLAVVVFTQHFRPYLLGREFTVRTDHGSLTWLRNFKEPEGQFARWLEKLQEYNFKIVHRGGKNHCNADALSRLPCRQCGRIFYDDLQSSSPDSAEVAAVEEESPQLTSLVQTDMDALYEAQRDDPALGPVLAAMATGNFPNQEEVKEKSLECRRLFQLRDQLVLCDKILYRKYASVDGGNTHLQLVVPNSHREEILQELHEGTTSGHLGEERTRGRLKERFYWPGHWNDVRKWCKTCAACASRKSPAPKPRAALQTVKAGSPMQMMAVDTLGPLPESSSGNIYVLVVADYFTKWMEVFPLPNQEASTVATRLVDEVFCRFSMPEQLHSDQGRQFESRIIEEVCKLLHIRKTHTTPYHPQSDGLVERFNRTLLNMLTTSIEQHPFQWEEKLRKVCFAYNTSVQSSTGYTPFFLMFGRQARLPVDLIFKAPSSDPMCEVPQYVSQLQQSLTSAYENVRVTTGAKQERQKENYDRHIHGKLFEVGYLVWLYSPAVRRGQSRKLRQPWTGPFRITSKLSDVTYRVRNLQARRQKLVVHFDRLKLCPAGMRLLDETTLPALQQEERPPTPPPCGTNLECLDPEDPPPPPRYPSRVRQPPTYLHPVVSH